MILKVQSIVEKGASKEKIGLRGPMPASRKNRKISLTQPAIPSIIYVNFIFINAVTGRST